MTDPNPQDVAAPPDLTFQITSFRTPAGQDTSWSQHTSGRLDFQAAVDHLREIFHDHQAASQQEALSGPVSPPLADPPDSTDQEQIAAQEDPGDAANPELPVL